jgi:folate-dependent phosphoribosylglycinamide formyltransferase PurN
MSERLGILTSGDRKSRGGGSTAERVVRDVLERNLVYEIGVVICNNPPGTVAVHNKIYKACDDHGLRGSSRITVVTVDHEKYPKQPGDPKRGMRLRESERYQRILEQHGIDFVWMLGFMMIANGELIEARGWMPEYGAADPTHNGIYHPDATLGNNHPSILPHTADTHGLGAHQKAIELFREGKITHTAMSYHLVSKDVDAGAMILEYPVSIDRADDAESLGDKVQGTERATTANAIDLHLLLRRQHLLSSQT